MSSRVVCPQCQLLMGVPEVLKPGKGVRCPKCQLKFVPPHGATAAAGAAPTSGGNPVPIIVTVLLIVALAVGGIVWNQLRDQPNNAGPVAQSKPAPDQVNNPTPNVETAGSELPSSNAANEPMPEPMAPPVKAPVKTPEVDELPDVPLAPPKKVTPKSTTATEPPPVSKPPEETKPAPVVESPKKPLNDKPTPKVIDTPAPATTPPPAPTVVKSEHPRQKEIKEAIDRGVAYLKKTTPIVTTPNSTPFGPNAGGATPLVGAGPGASQFGPAKSDLAQPNPGQSPKPGFGPLTPGLTPQNLGGAPLNPGLTPLNPGVTPLNPGGLSPAKPGLTLPNPGLTLPTPGAGPLDLGGAKPGPMPPLLAPPTLGQGPPKLGGGPLNPGGGRGTLPNAGPGGQNPTGAPASQDPLATVSACLRGLTLLECRVSAADPTVQALARQVRTAGIPEASKRNYVLSAMILFLDKLGDSRDRELIQACALSLVAGQTARGGWTYEGPDLSQADYQQLQTFLKATRLNDKSKSIVPQRQSLPPRVRTTHVVNHYYAKGEGEPTGFEASAADDNFNTQFAMMALWAARRHGVPTERCLQLAANRLRSTQNGDGGWGNKADDASTPLMTCASLLGLAMDVAMAPADNAKTRVTDLPAVAKGLAKLGDKIDPKELDNCFFLWSIERVGLLYRQPSFGNQDWYALGVDALLPVQAADGSFTSAAYEGQATDVDTCFALLFLRRANLLQDLTERLAKVP